jgi:ATP-dependent DNA ligase
MQTVVAPRNPYAKLATRFREELRWRAARLEEVQLEDGEPVVATVKMDGELAVIHTNVDAGFSQVYNRTDKARWGFPAADEMAQCLVQAGTRQVIAFGELYAIDDRGKSLRLAALNSILKRKQPTREQVGRLALAVFDLYQVGDDVVWGRMPYPDRFALLHRLFADCERVRPVAGKALRGEPSALASMWQRYVLDRGYEGIVLRGDAVQKVKPVHTLDCAVVGFKMGTGKNFGKVGSLALALRAESGVYVYVGLVGSGLTNTQREAWTQRLVGTPTGTGPKGMETGQHVKWAGELRLVAPHFVVEVETETITKKVQPSLFFDRDLGRWDLGGGKKAGIALKHPRFVQERPDKSALNKHDVRLGQVPGWEGGGDAPKIEEFVRRIGVDEERVYDVVRAAQRVPGPLDAKLAAAQRAWDEFQREGVQIDWEAVVIPEPRGPVLDPERRPSQAIIEQEEFEDLIGQAVPELERFLMRKMPNIKPQDAEAAAAAAAWKAIRAFRGELGQRPRPGRKLMPWLREIAWKSLLDIWKEGGKKKKEWEQRVLGAGPGATKAGPGVLEREVGGRKFLR